MALVFPGCSTIQTRSARHPSADGHTYLTVVLDLDTGRVVFVGKGRKESSLKPFWKRLKASRAKILAVAIDLSAAYQLAVRKHLPEAHVVFDRFHIIKLYNEKLTGLRRALYGEATDLLWARVAEFHVGICCWSSRFIEGQRNSRQSSG